MEKQKNENSKTLVIFDDSTGNTSLFYAGSEKGSKNVKFLSQIRHLNASLILIAHSASSVLNNLNKNLGDFVFLLSCPNIKTVQNVWETWLTIKMDFNTFKAMYLKEIESKEYPNILFSTFDKNKYDLSVNNWEWLKESRDFCLSTLKK